jgi:hypothetical protein
MDLREETRAAEQAKPTLNKDAYGQRATGLATTQEELAVRVGNVTEQICELPDGEAKFGDEIALLGRVEEVMREAAQLLSRPDTGPEPIAAETEAIELLLLSRRINPKGGGGGGSSPGGGSTGDTDQSALALLGSGVERQAKYEPRAIQQATGNSGVELPAEYRHGLDAFFEALEQSGRSSTN